jgi:transposase
MAERKKFTAEFKKNAIELLENRGDKTAEEVAKSLGVKSGRLYKWKAAADRAKKDGTRAFPGNGNARDEELRKLRKENKELREINEILKKAAAVLLVGSPR